MLGDAAGLVFLPDHEAGDVLQEHQRYAALAGQFDKVRAFLCRLAEQHAVIGDDRHRIAMQMGKAADQGAAIQRLEFVEYRVVHQPGNHFAHVIGLFWISRHNAVQVGGGVAGRYNRFALQLACLAPVEVGNAAPGNGQRMFIVFGIMVSHAGGPAMHIGATQILGTDDLTGSRLDQGRAGEKDGRLLAHHDGFIGHCRHIGAAGGTGPHDHGNLRNTPGTHVRLVVEDPAKVLAIGKYLVLARQVGTAGVDQIDARQAVLLGNRLGAQMLLHRQRIIGAAFDRRIVGDNHAFNTFNAADTGDKTASWNILTVHLVGCELTDFQKGRARIEQSVDTLTWQQLAPRQMPLLRLLTAALADLRQQLLQLIDKRAHGSAVGGEVGGAGMDLCIQHAHRSDSMRSGKPQAASCKLAVVAIPIQSRTDCLALAA